MTHCFDINSIESEKLDWDGIIFRLEEYRKENKLDKFQFANKLEIAETSLSNLLRHRKGGINLLWQIKKNLKVSLNWLLNGVGNCCDVDTDSFKLDTIPIHKGAGIRRPLSVLDGETGAFSDEVLEFVLAVDKFKKKNSVPFPSLTQIYQIVLALGYRKQLKEQVIDPLPNWQKSLEQNLTQL